MKRQHLQADCLEIFYMVGERAAKSAEKPSRLLCNSNDHRKTTPGISKLINVSEQKMGCFCRIQIKGLFLELK